MEKIRTFIRHILLEYISREDVEDVKQTAYLVHHGQKRRDGTPYISHPLEVYNITKRYYPSNQGAQLLALLHDTLEDAEKVGNLTQDEAFQMIQNSIHDRKILIQINRALELLTHDKSVPYVEYLQSVLSNPLAGIVKISDLIHNLSHNPSPRQIKKYSDALSAVRIPRWISDEHKKELLDILGFHRK
ncbi:MAG: hypothetical protein CBC29_06635 [Methylococcaceae bacterium TMED69]|nr:MAG: hypothetical protein CBC29_06635 [Methylococcaceae bacterium TMED69]|tara:strand:- start:48 stop:611 length:564 start_codon:yes stop_codon:yes gene_type:complete